MDYKHFSHSHNLMIHQMPEGIQVSCSGCNSSCNGTVFVCWQCNFFLHEQCYRATRSLKHPSHPHHPLSLIPYPTYPSNSFYCNSCEIIGTGFSYSCSDCEFDLHVQCAHSLSRATSFQKTHPFQELVPQSWIDGHNVPFVSVSDHSLPIPFTSSQNPYMPPSSLPDQYHPTGHDLAYVSAPPSIPSVHDPMPPSSLSDQYHPTGHDLGYVSAPPSRQNSITTVHDPTAYPNPVDKAQYPSIVQTDHSVFNPPNPTISHFGPPVSAPPNSITNIHDQPIYHDPIAQMGHSVSNPPNPTVSHFGHPVSAPPNSIPNIHDPTTYHDPIAQTGHAVSNPPNPTISHFGPPVSAPPNSIPNIHDPTTFHDPIAQTGHSVSHTTNPPNTFLHAQDSVSHVGPLYPSIDHTTPSVSIPNTSHNSISNAPHTGTSVSIPPTRPQAPSMPQNGSKDKGVMHFSHPHILSALDLQESEENEITCSACEATLIGKGYVCVEPKCDFHLHESCFNLKKEIHHESHPEHPLTLLPLAPYNNENREFTCNACFSDGTGYTYHCSICTFDLHIQCVSLPETMKRDDHEHELKLYYSCPMKGDRDNFTCHVCHEEVPLERWVYYCEPCDYGTHLGCVDCEECEGDSTVSDAHAHLISVMDTQAQLQRLQIQMQMASQQAQFMASLGASLANLA